jgi:type IV pilus assembly protein PilY1
MTRFFQHARKLWLPAAASTLAVLIAGSTAQTPPAMPTVDLSVGPVAINAQAVNIALALSVEFPTVGAAYRTVNYDHAVTYLGYLDPKGCYAYFDTTAGAPLGGEYFYRTGSVDASGYCESSTGRYSGNALNYITTSSIDLLRYALTGGNRVVDTAGTTILERAYLRDSWNLHNSTYFPVKKIAAALVGKVTPPMETGTGPHTGDVYAGGCWDRVFFGTSNGSVGCDTAATTTSGDLNRRVINPSTLQTGKVLFGSPIPGTALSPTLGTVTWEVSSPLRTVTSAPTAGPTTDTFTYYVSVVGTTVTTPPVGSGLSSATVSLSYTPVTVGVTTSTTAVPTSTYPTLGSEPDRSIQGYITATMPGTGVFDSTNPGTGANGIQLGGVFTIVNNSNANRNRQICKLGSRIVGKTTDGNPVDADNAFCSANLPGSTRMSLRSALGWSSSNNNSQVFTGYKIYQLTPYYKRYTITKNMQNWEPRTGWREWDQYQYYTYYTGTQAVPMYARTRVCDDVEKTIRTDLCERYPDGNYKPVGEIQRYGSGVRVAAFGYLKDDTSSAYGGVLRAPMKYMGPTYIDPNGQPQTNSQAEWDANNGVFATNPLGATSPFTSSGVINYLNKFGTSGAVKGYYKGLDPVGELYYEALRYYQGLQPSSQAVSVYTSDTSKADGFPVYTSWTDPVQNACERRNFILTIGDVNTHYDKQLPGHRSPNGVNSFLTEDPARAVVSIPGSTATFNAVTWTDLLTGFEMNTAKSYTDALGRSQTTAGNPNENDDNSALDSTATGSGGHSAYYWAGAAYWANTQSIRLDSKGTPSQSMKDIRVKTFTIDVDEGGNGDIEDSNPRGIKPRRSSFYLAGKYGWFNDANLDGNPFVTSGGAISNKEWEDKAAPNTPDGYVIASQAQKMINGIRKFFKAASSDRGSVSVSAISSARYTSDAPNGDFFAPQFSAGDWSGTVQRSRLVLNTTTGTVESTNEIVWDAGEILTTASNAPVSVTLADPYVRPADRNIITMATVSGATTGVLFNVANKNSFDSAVLSALNSNPTNTATDNLADQRINWIRGDHSYEMNTGTLRRRGSIMGDVINSGPVYKQAADPNLSGTGYLAFAQSVKNRPAMIYVGANDGMMHAFRADNGKELFAYIPRAVATHLNKLTHPSYVHRPYVDGVPQIGEAQVGGNWKTLLVSGMGGGAQGVFALDVSNPTSFGVDNVLFEFTDANDPDMGNVLTQPTLVKLKVPGATPSDPATYKWFVAVGSGYNNYKPDGSTSSTGAQAMFFLSVDKAPSVAWAEGTNYFKVVLPVSSTGIVNGLVSPGFITGPNGEAKLLYAGDLQGNMWKFDLSAGISSSNLNVSVFQSGGVRKPVFVAEYPSGTRQPITTAPQIIEANGYGYMVVFGTGKFVEPSDTATAAQQSIYGIWDSLETSDTSFTVPRNKLYPRPATLSNGSVTLGTATFVYGKDTGQYRGWAIDLPETRERISVESALGIGAVIFSAAIPEGTCSGDGTGRKYCLNPVYGTSVCGSFASTPGIPSGPKIFQIELDDSSYTARSPSGRRSVTIEQQVVSSSTKITDAGNALVDGKKLQSITIPAGRMSWRELRN